MLYLRAEWLLKVLLLIVEQVLVAADVVPVCGHKFTIFINRNAMQLIGTAMHLLLRWDFLLKLLQNFWHGGKNSVNIHCCSSKS